MTKNPKTQGEKGQLITIGELAKWDIQVAIPLSDNLPWDLILIYKNKLYKAQIKSGERSQKHSKGSICFNTSTNNWNKGTTKKYTKKDIDLMILCDYKSIYLLGKEDFEDVYCFSIRTSPPANNQKKGIHLAEDYIISSERLSKILI